MAEIPGFWDVGPHDPLTVEATWNEFIAIAGGRRVQDLISQSPDFDNADYMFPDFGVVVELKEIRTEFFRTKSVQRKFDELLVRWGKEDARGYGMYPDWFPREVARLIRPSIIGVLKKANRQIRETKEYFGINQPFGTLVLVNDGFTGMAPNVVQALAGQELIHSYSSIDCLLYVTVNRYVEVSGSYEPRLVWYPAYSSRTTDQLPQFIDDLGRKWRAFLEQKIGPFTSAVETTDNSALSGSRAIVLPHEEGH